MELQGDDIALYLSGQPVPIKACNIVAVQPTVRQIVAFKESDFLLAANFLGKPEPHIRKLRENNSQLDNYSDYQIYIALMRQDESLNKAVTNFFELVFPGYIIEIDDDISFLQEERRVGTVDPFNYQDFKDTIKYMFLLTKTDSKDYNPANAKARAIADKFAKAHEKINQNKKAEDNKSSLFATYTSVLSIGMNIDINILYSYTPFQLYNLFSRYWKKVNSDFYQKVSTTPMMDVSKMEQPDDWSGNIY